MYIEVKVKMAYVVHGFDENNKEIVETINEDNFVNKLISVNRIQSITESFILVTGSHGRVLYWEYDSDFIALREQLRMSGFVIE